MTAWNIDRPILDRIIEDIVFMKVTAGTVQDVQYTGDYGLDSLAYILGVANTQDWLDGNREHINWAGISRDVLDLFKNDFLDKFMVMKEQENERKFSLSEAE